MKFSRRYRFALWAAIAPVVLAAGVARAQQIRFTAPSDSAISSAVSSAGTSTYSTGTTSSGLPDGGTWVARLPSSSSGPTAGSTFPASSSTILPAPGVSPAPTYTTSSAPIYLAAAPSYGVTPLPSPASAYGASLGTPTGPGSGFDPYLMAARSAAFSGTITSTGGQYIVPQPMPRVPYYTQQPVAASNQPYVVIPEPNCAAPVAQPTPLVYSTPTQAPVVSMPGPTAPAYVAPPTVPMLIPQPALAPPPIYASRWYIDVDAIFFTRINQLGNTPLVLLDNSPSDRSNVLLSTENLNFDYQVGPRILVGYEIDPAQAVEGSYFGIFNWKATASVTGDNNLNLPGALGQALNLNFADADQASITYKAIIHNAELNYVRTWGNISGILGFRYFHLGETLDITFTDVQTGTSTYEIKTFNNLFGGQLGLRLTQTCGNWEYDLTGKAGVYGNAINMTQNAGDFGLPAIRNTNINSGQVAFIGDLAINVSYQFSANWSLRGGYQAYCLEGVALAPGQLDFSDDSTSGTTINKNDGLFMHGAHAGLMARW